MLLVAVFMTGCRANYPVAQQSGKEDVAFLLLVSQKNYINEELTVKIDDTEFEAKAVSAKKSNRRGKAYTVATGRRKLTVTDKQGQTLYKREVMLSTQETKQIMLP